MACYVSQQGNFKVPKSGLFVNTKAIILNTKKPWSFNKRAIILTKMVTVQIPSFMHIYMSLKKMLQKL